MYLQIHEMQHTRGKREREREEGGRRGDTTRNRRDAAEGKVRGQGAEEQPRVGGWSEKEEERACKLFFLVLDKGCVCKKHESVFILPSSPPSTHARAHPSTPQKKSLFSSACTTTAVFPALLHAPKTSARSLPLRPLCIFSGGKFFLHREQKSIAGEDWLERCLPIAAGATLHRRQSDVALARGSCIRHPKQQKKHNRGTMHRECLGKARSLETA